MQQSKHVAIVVPGIMGSCLERDARTELWTEDIRANYRRLVTNPAILQYDGTAAKAPRVLEAIHFPLGIWKVHLLGRLLQFLRKQPSFSHKLGVLTFAYDWRESVATSARNLGSFLRQKLSALLEKQRCGLTFVTHSMGGLVARLALMDGHVNHSVVENVIHIAPPFLGSPAAFRSIFHKCNLPLVEDFIWLCYGLKNGRLALENLRRVLSSFPSMYELMPPVSEAFLYMGATGMANPLAAPHVVIDPAICNQARDVHEKIRASLGQLPKWGIKTHTIYATGGPDQTDEQYKVFEDAARYEVLEPVPYVFTNVGDGTVTARSCTFDGRDATNSREVVGEKHAYLCNSKKVIQVLATLT